MIKVILFDFDGVILDSLPVREYGFRQIFAAYPQNLVEQLIEYHNRNGGLSRFHKIKYFYSNILGKEIDETSVLRYSQEFSNIMRKELVKSKYIIQETMFFIKKHAFFYKFHIVSGSEHEELNFLCQKLKINQFFKSINGSPKPKIELVKSLLNSTKYSNNEIILIGDSINDYDAAFVNGIDFYGYNNEQLREISTQYLENYSPLFHYYEK
jgi:HAD superfamily hydrolase (TIGR01549 family)